MLGMNISNQEILCVILFTCSSGKLHVALLIEQMKLLKQIGDLKNYWMCCELLLSRHCAVLKNYEELKIALQISVSYKQKISKILKFRVFKGQDVSDLEFKLAGEVLVAVIC